MVAQDGHSPVGPVVGQDLGRNVLLLCKEERTKQSLLAMPGLYLTCENGSVASRRDVPLVSSFSCACRVIEAL